MPVDVSSVTAAAAAMPATAAAFACLPRAVVFGFPEAVPAACGAVPPPAATEALGIEAAGMAEPEPMAPTDAPAGTSPAAAKGRGSPSSGRRRRNAMSRTPKPIITSRASTPGRSAGLPPGSPGVSFPRAVTAATSAGEAVAAALEVASDAAADAPGVATWPVPGAAVRFGGEVGLAVRFGALVAAAFAVGVGVGF
ncbi:MAG TPA: hypothetical protein VGQ31_05810, partial [Candidatus Limnocylindrales bacterium]|nr:hypothetical protein [Candidatus Limnocylindrales bacterium]